ncbi:MAG TPA: enoyl-CoA hydratase/isomerase family protein [Acidimicrobiales bacterium]
MSRLGRSLALTHSRVNTRWRRATKAFRDRRRPRLAAPPATGVESEKHGHGVLEIRLVGGDRRNVLGRSTIDRIEQLVAEPPAGTRVIVITAAPPDFCAGYDLVEASRGGAENLIANEANFATLRRGTVPIVVAVQGNVIGGGLELALSADIRVASPEATFAIPATKLGLVYSEAGIRLIVDAVGESVARALFLAGRALNAESALSMGLVTEIVGREQLRDRALDLAELIASWSEIASSGNRQILDVIAGRISADTGQLRFASFAPEGDLSQSIARFVARRRHSSKPLVE